MHYIYLLQTPQFIASKQPVFKLGRICQLNHNRFVSYPKGSIVLSQNVSRDCYKDEKELIKLFKVNFKFRSDVGLEYFEGDYRQMILLIVQHLNFISLPDDYNCVAPVKKWNRKTPKTDKTLDSTVSSKSFVQNFDTPEAELEHNMKVLEIVNKGQITDTLKNLLKTPMLLTEYLTKTILDLSDDDFNKIISKSEEPEGIKEFKIKAVKEKYTKRILLDNVEKIVGVTKRYDVKTIPVDVNVEETKNKLLEMANEYYNLYPDSAKTKYANRYTKNIGDIKSYNQLQKFTADVYNTFAKNGKIVNYDSKIERINKIKTTVYIFS